MNHDIDVKHWLTSNGFERFVELFAENEIDAEVLADLSREDLRELGLPLGVQKKMLRLIERLTGSELEGGVRISQTSQSGVAEHRQLTVMFVDLAGSTALSSNMDAEAFRELIVAYQDTCNKVIKKHDGFVARLFGDALLVYFGYPVANENDAERAVHTAIKLIEAIEQLSNELKPTLGVDLAIRIGIATGPAIVGDLMGEGVAQEAVALGDAPNLAARLQGLAGSNQVAVAPKTQRILAGRFRFNNLGPKEIAGLTEPVNVWLVEQEIQAISRFEAAQTKELVPLVGRDEEFDMLKRRWQYATEGEGQVALITGEAGIGKSRLALALADSLNTQQLRVLRYQCSPYQTSSALYPIIERARLSAGIEPADDPAEKIGKLRYMVEQLVDEQQTALALLADLLSVPVGDDVPTLTLTARQKKEATFEVLKNQFLGLSSDMPLLAVFEDVHWVDPTTLELLEYMVTLVQNYRILLVVTYRPGFKAQWSGEANTTLFSLTKLRSSNSLQLISSLCSGKSLPDEVTQMVIEKTDGIPLFVEELTKTLLESGALTEHDDRYTLDAPLPPSAIPDTLQDSLMARLDRLGDGKEVAQVAAVIGREFGHDVLRAILPDVNLEQALAKLQEAGLLFRHGTITNPQYLFKHALIRDTAYESMLKSKRQKIHGQIADTLANNFPERAALEPHLLAHHYTKSNRLEEAIPNWIAAASMSYGRFANLEAIAHSEHGLEAASTLPDTPARMGQQLQLQFLRGAAYRVTQGYASHVAEQSFREAMALALKLNLIDHYTDANRGLFAAFYVSGRLQESLELGKELQQAAQTPMQEMQALYMIGSIDFWFGNLEQAREGLERSMSLYDNKALTGLALQLDPGVMARIYNGLTLAHSGYTDQATHHSAEAVRASEELQQPLTLGQTLLFSAMTSYHCEQDFMPEILKLQALSVEHKIPFQQAAVDVFLGLQKMFEGNAEEGLALSEKGYNLYCALGVKSGFTMTLCILARECLASFQADKALEWLQKASEIVNETGEKVNQSEVCLLQGQALLMKQDEKAAEAAFIQGLSLARKCSARLHELRNATELATLWMERDERLKALELLRPVHDWFSEGSNSPSLKRSQKLLQLLG